MLKVTKSMMLDKKVIEKIVDNLEVTAQHVNHLALITTAIYQKLNTLEKNMEKINRVFEELQTHPKVDDNPDTIKLNMN